MIIQVSELALSFLTLMFLRDLEGSWIFLSELVNITLMSEIETVNCFYRRFVHVYIHIVLLHYVYMHLNIEKK